MTVRIDVNPYGINAITYVFRSYGINIINENILEMATVTVHHFLGKVLLLTLFFVLSAALNIVRLAARSLPCSDQRYHTQCHFRRNSALPSVDCY